MIKPLLLLLLALCLFGACLAYFIVPKYSFSIVAGICVVFLSNAYFVLRVFRYSGKKLSGESVAPVFLKASMGRLSVASCLFALLFVGVFDGSFFAQPDQAFALMLSFLCVYLAYIVLVAIWLVLR